MKVRASAAAILLVAVAASASFGQDGPRRPFGGGFGGAPGSVFRIAGNGEVQKELNLKLDQVDKLKALREEMVKEMTSGERPNFRELRDLSREEREKKMEEMRAKAAEAAKKANEKFRPKLAEILEPAQLERVQQIAWQAAGARALQDPELVKALKISKEQEEKIAAVNKEFDEKQREMFRGAERGKFEEMRTKMSELNSEREKKTLEVLSTDQQAQLTKLKGKEFDVSKLREGFGGGRRRGEGGPRRRRGNDN